MTATPRLPFRAVEKEFMTRSATIYRHMVERFTEKRDKRERIIRIGRTVPFKLEDLREWLETKLGGEGGVVQCAYCSTYVSAADLQIDHDVPVSRGGELTFDNLRICDSLCNQEKGAMTGEEYIKFKTWIGVNMSPEAYKDIRHRLLIAVKLANRARRDMARKAQRQTEETDEDKTF